MNMQLLDDALNSVRSHLTGNEPRCAVVLGSGCSQAADFVQAEATIAYAAIPGLGKPGVQGHAGHLVYGRSSGLPTLVFCGRRHWYEGEGWEPIAIPIYICAKLGVRIIVLTNAAGGIRGDLEPGNVMIIKDHINLMGSNPLLGMHHDVWGPRFPDQSAVYDPGLRSILEHAAREAGLSPACGTYMGVNGPTYETPAEIDAFERLGADAIGMSTVPESILANAAGIKVGGLSCIANQTRGRTDKAVSHSEVLCTVEESARNISKMLVAAWRALSEDHSGLLA
jgi:purine-nucleoside phosphorylase